MHQSLFVSFYNKNLPNNKVYQNVLAEVHMIMEIFLGPPESINQSIKRLVLKGAINFLID